ncbi:flagellar basal body rod modification protein [Stenotrophomonas daejeonensis]|uniref:Basal-body rod modification protein FlgD n=1 Tax=Stenotrophomonas daejeonensis TaxID=659018 RepID=A0A0R0DTX5_9GAMM|nr:flagellar hook capping FlgD N-terminal domain-containing protein [Stenotrophomonas daejeonensis]KRG81986.1 flagellar basal body rod modification protein [Stenotrophomonas daejeonensis]
MSSVPANNELFGSLGLTAAASQSSKKKDTLDQADFLRLMSTQLQHQDPLKPMDNSQMVAQMAQLSTVQGISDLNDTVSGFQQAMAGDQILKGAALVGHEVLVPSTKLSLEDGGGASGTVAAPGSGYVTIDITDANGVKVTQLSVPAEASGEVQFQWDGTDADGKRMPAGAYNVTATYTDGEGAQSTLSTYVQAEVESVTVGSDGLYLNLKGLGAAPLDYVLRVS